MLTRWDPFREMVSMRRAMDRLIDNSFGEEMAQTPEWGLALDVFEDEDRYLVKASVAGINPEDIDVTYAKGMLTIKGEIKDESESTKGQYHLRERRFGSFARTISLPSHIKAEEIHADYKDGILTLEVPKAEEVKPKRIPIGSGSSERMIEGRSN
jgi:HSP20 family protein